MNPNIESTALRAMRILVTRPEGRADALMTAIAAHGGNPVHIPMLTIQPLREHDDMAIWAATTQYMRGLDRYHRVIAISVNALHFAMPWIKRYWPSVPSQIAWYGIGAATIAAFAQYGIAAQGSTADGAMTSEALLALPDLQHLSRERILILRGVGGRERLATVLRERGAQVDYAELYRRVEPALSTRQRTQLQAMAFDAISVNSDETLQNLWQCLTPAARQTACARALIAPSERVADHARQLGFARVVVAPNASTEATIAALLKYAGGNFSANFHP